MEEIPNPMALSFLLRRIFYGLTESIQGFEDSSPTGSDLET